MSSGTWIVVAILWLLTDLLILGFMHGATRGRDEH